MFHHSSVLTDLTFSKSLNNISYNFQLIFKTKRKLPIQFNVGESLIADFVLDLSQNLTGKRPLYLTKKEREKKRKQRKEMRKKVEEELEDESARSLRGTSVDIPYFATVSCFLFAMLATRFSAHRWQGGPSVRPANAKISH
ncbi:hypothetical protein M0802_006186 [Mischocyttarus mexicanus]|nr:hypothetical protein M0802_006186 [Mischocyttarus mexicanus]